MTEKVNVKAVILAGGLGVRMLPVTEHLPKALVKIDGLPIIHKQLNQLEENNFDEVLVLTGHRGSQIEEYLKNLKFKFDLKCLWSSINLSPAERLIEFKEEIGDKFTLLYCDNFLPESKEIFRKNQISKYRFILNTRDKGNIKITKENRFEIMTSERNSNYPFVELGYISIQDSNFFPALIRCRDLNQCFKNLAEHEQFEYIEYTKPYYSLSNIESYLKIIDKSKIILLDRDGIINMSVGHRKYVTNFSEFKFVQNNLDFLRRLSAIGFNFIVITNQPGIATGQVDSEFVWDLHAMISLKFLEYKINLLSIYICQHHWDDNCNCRKPKPGLIKQAIKEFKLENQTLLFIGDEEKDLEAAKSAKINGIVVNEGLGDIDNYGLIRNASKLIQELYGVVLE